MFFREWCRYRYGVFPEAAVSSSDKMYPATYAIGNKTLPSQGCPKRLRRPFCPNGEEYDRSAPTKQNLLCLEASAEETILKHDDFKGNTTEYAEPEFSYIEHRSAGGQRYSLVLEHTGAMSDGGRWTTVKRAAFRFLQWVPAGSVVSVVAYGKQAKLVLPPTVVDSANREALHGRVPRQAPSDGGDLACVYCAMNLSLQTLKEGNEEDVAAGTIILVTGSPRRPQLLEDLIRLVREAPVRVFPVIYPGTAHPDISRLAVYGKLYAVPEGGPQQEAQAHLTAALLDVLHQTEPELAIQKLHESSHASSEFAGTFAVGEGAEDAVAVTLSVDDEEKVESFELTGPSGRKHLLSRFEDGMVVFDTPKGATSGVWTFHAKLYEGEQSTQRVTVDVVSRMLDVEKEPIIMEAWTDADVISSPRRQPVIVYARLMAGSRQPVAGASVRALVHPPGARTPPVELQLRDDGSGLPDVTEGDGIYSAIFSSFSSVPGYYSIRVTANDGHGVASILANEGSETGEAAAWRRKTIGSN